jgi:hypothetical protein
MGRFFKHLGIAFFNFATRHYPGGASLKFSDNYNLSR